MCTVSILNAVYLTSADYWLHLKMIICQVPTEALFILVSRCHLL